MSVDTARMSACATVRSLLLLVVLVFVNLLADPVLLPVHLRFLRRCQLAAVFFALEICGLFGGQGAVVHTLRNALLLALLAPLDLPLLGLRCGFRLGAERRNQQGRRNIKMCQFGESMLSKVN